MSLRATVSRAIATSTVLVLTVSSCERPVTMPPSSLAIKPQSRVDLLLDDQTTLTMRDAHLGYDDLIRGRVTACDGEGCSGVTRDGGVRLGHVTKMVAHVPDRGEGAAMWAVGTVLVLGAVGGLAVIALSGSTHSATTSTASYGGSCPHVYSWSGSGWQLDSGTFGGSQFAAAQLTDHDLLEHLVPQDGKLRLRLVNEMPEAENTDALSLRVVDHPAGTRVVPTAAGKLVTFRNPTGPLVATDLRGVDALDLVSTRDGREWTSDLSDRDPRRVDDARDGLLLQFPKPPRAKRAKLWITARNTQWAADMLEYLLSELGPALPGWYATMNTEPAARKAFSAFMEREGSLVARVKTPGGWTARGVVSVAGAEILKDQALEIPVDDVPGDRVTLRLDAPVAFWTVDSVAVSFEDDEPLEVRDLAPASAEADDGADVLPLLAAIDGERYATVRGNHAELSFDAPAAPRPGMSRSYVLVSTGYYVPDVPPNAHPDPAEFARVTSDPDLASQEALAMLNLTLARRLLR